MPVQPSSVLSPVPLPGPDIREGRRRPSYRPPLGLWALRLRTCRVPVLAVLAVIPLYGVWAAFLATGGGDLAAQYAWAGFAARNPDTAYGLFWYGGTHTANYSVLSPPLMAVLGVRTVSVLSGVAATWLLGSLLERTVTRAPRWPALLGAFGLWANVASGRTTFALGLAIGLAGLLALAGRADRTGRLTAAAVRGDVARRVDGHRLVRVEGHGGRGRGVIVTPSVASPHRPSWARPSVVRVLSRFWVRCSDEFATGAWSTCARRRQRRPNPPHVEVRHVFPPAFVPVLRPRRPL